MKVLYIIDSLQTGGAETSLLEISSRLTRLKPIVCILYSKKSDLRKQFQQKGIGIIDLNITSGFWWFEGVLKLKKVLRQINPDLIHAILFKSEIVTRLALLGSGKPHVGSFVNDSYAPARYKQQSFLRNFKLNVVRLADAVTAQTVPNFMSITETIAKTNAKALLLDPKKITCIYRGRNIDNFPVFHPPQDGSPFIFLIVGRLLIRKGYLELFDAAKQLSSKGHNFLIRIAGDGHDHNLFEETVIKLNIKDKVQFLFNRQDIPDLLAHAHCFVFPSHYEGQGGALVEAMLAAKPIIASNIPVFQEQIIHEQTGKLFTLFDVEDLTKKMEWMMLNYSAGIALGLKAREVAVKRFNIDNTVRLHEDLYVKMLH